jgi:hypothetical protein
VYTLKTSTDAAKDQLDKLAGQTTKITGDLKGETIDVTSVQPAKSVADLATRPVAPQRRRDRTTVRFGSIAFLPQIIFTVRGRRCRQRSIACLLCSVAPP